MSARPAAPRRTCPVCAKRYAGLIDPLCLVCRGLGVLTLGAAALHHYDPAAIARAVEVYLEAKAQAIRARVDYPQRREALEAAVDDLRVAGVLASAADVSGQPAHAPAPHDTASARVTELNAYRAATDYGTPPTPQVLNALAAPPLTDLADARPRNGTIPTASTTGHVTALATIADAIDPLGPDTAAIRNGRVVADYRAKVIAASVTTAATRRRRRP